MPAVSQCWRHVILNTRCSWLHGDPRGFRDRHHRIHSSGDYRNPPPEGEHAGLHAWMKRRSGDKVRFDETLWSTIADALVRKLTERDHPVLAIAVDTVHIHFLAEMPLSLSSTKHEAGIAKRFVTECVKQSLSGHLWARGGTFKPIRDRAHQLQVFHYILEKQRPAWVWDFQRGGRMVQ